MSIFIVINNCKKLIWIIGVIIVFLTCLSLCEADVPNITANDLSDIIESYQKKFYQVQFKYTIIHGSFENNDEVQGKFIPMSPPWTVEAEFAKDFLTGAEYIYEDKLSSGKHWVNEAVFDGKYGTQLNQLEPDSNEWRGSIVSGPTDMLKTDTPKNCQPLELSYWPFEGYDLPKIIRKSSNIKIEEDKISGHKCYKTTFLFEDKRVISVKGEKKEVTVPQFYRIWFAQDINMLPIRFERLRQNEDPYLLKEKPEIEFVRQLSDFKEVIPGIWYPFSSIFVNIWPDNIEPFVFMVQIKEVIVNKDDIVKKKVRFPDGTRVKDSVANIRYIVGLSSENLFDEAKSVTEEIKGLQENSFKPKDPNYIFLENTIPAENLQTENLTITNTSIHEGEKKKYGEKNSPFLLLSSAAGISILIIILFTFYFFHWYKRINN